MLYCPGASNKVNNCPSPETLIDYIEGRIEGSHRQDLYEHIATCKDCTDTLQAVFDMPTEEELKKIEVPKEAMKKAKRIPKEK